MERPLTETQEITREAFRGYLDEVNELKKQAAELNSTAGGLTRAKNDEFDLNKKAVSWARALQGMEPANREISCP